MGNRAPVLDPTTLTLAATGLPGAAVATGNGTVFDCRGFAGVRIKVTGSFTATLTPQVATEINPTNWVGCEAVRQLDGSKNSTITAAGEYVILCPGAFGFRIPVTWTSGTSVTVVAVGLASDLSAFVLADQDVTVTPSGTQDVNVAKYGGTAVTLGQKTMAASQPVVLASDQTDVPTKERRSATSTTSNVASSATNVTLLASNTNRLGATIFNDSTAVLSAKLGATASATSFTVQLLAGGYYEVPFNYTGQIDGIWASANGSARLTELSA